jgi:hypothetical protein
MIFDWKATFPLESAFGHGGIQQGVPDWQQRGDDIGRRHSDEPVEHAPSRFIGVNCKECGSGFVKQRASKNELCARCRIGRTRFV